jgi:hypothetical protein
MPGHCENLGDEKEKIRQVQSLLSWQWQALGEDRYLSDSHRNKYVTLNWNLCYDGNVYGYHKSVHKNCDLASEVEKWFLSWELKMSLSAEKVRAPQTEGGRSSVYTAKRAGEQEPEWAELQWDQEESQMKLQRWAGKVSPEETREKCLVFKPMNDVVRQTSQKTNLECLPGLFLENHNRIYVLNLIKHNS